MSKYTDEAERLFQIQSPHYNCAQRVLCAFAEDAGISQDLACRIGANFGGGMKCGSVCGAVTGGLMVLGLFGIDDPKSVQEFLSAFRGNHDGMFECQPLLQANAKTGLPRAQHCQGLVLESIGLLENMLREAGKIA